LGVGWSDGRDYPLFNINLPIEKNVFLNLKTKNMSKTKTDLTEKEVVQFEDTNAASANGQKNLEDRELFLIPNLESICEKIGY
jgi:hypothetical protein